MIGIAKTHAPPKPSPFAAELPRILNLPVRPLPTQQELQQLVERYTDLLSKKNVKCECQTKYKRRCPDRLLPLQAWSLHEGKQCGGLMGAIPVGEGKTLMDILMPMMFPGTKNWVLLVRKSLKAQLLQLNWPFYEQHWNLPNLAGPGSKWFDPKRPVLHVHTYGELSHEKSTAMLKDLNPDGIIGDEIHALRDPDTARGLRFYRRVKDERPDTMVFGWSGTLLKDSVEDMAPLGAVILKQGSPWPLYPQLISELALQVDPVFDVVKWGKVKEIPARTQWDRLKISEKTVREALLRRVKETPGYISSDQKSSCASELNIKPRVVPVPPRVLELLKNIETLAERPDGEILKLALEKYRCMSQMVSGFYYRWTWPRGEPPALRAKWLEARKKYFSEVRAKLGRDGSEGKDSVGLLSKAAQRWHRGYIFEDEYVPPYSLKKTGVPIWKSEHWKAWKEIEDECQPETETVWESDYLVQDAAKWAHEHRKPKDSGVLWYTDVAFGIALQKATGLKLYAGGAKASEEIIFESGEKCIIASIAAHGTGKELQMFHNALVCDPPSAGDEWEQLLGRHHRQGQLSNVVDFEVYRHCSVYERALDKALLLSEFIEQGQGSEQKLKSKANKMW